MSQFERHWYDYIFAWGNIQPQIHPTSKEWDIFINKAADEGQIKYNDVGLYTKLRIGNIQIWCSGYPYAYGSSWSISEKSHTPLEKAISPYGLNAVPSKVTRYRLRRLEKKLAIADDYEKFC